MSHGNQLHGHKDTTEISQGLSHVRATSTDTPNCQTQSLPFGWLVPRGLIPDRVGKPQPMERKKLGRKEK